MEMMWGLGLILGFVLGAAFLVFARRRGAQRERRLLTVGLVVAALIYVGFAVAWADAAWVMIELGGVLVFTGLAVLGLKRSALSLAVGWALHPAWDVGLHLMGAGAAFAPAWYVVACISFDLLVAAYVLVRFRRTPVESQTV